jgi:hypothetical protein
MAALPPQPPATEPPQPPAAPPSLPPLPQPPSVYLSQTPQRAYAGAYAVAPAAPSAPRHRTGMIVLAQLLMILKGIFWLLGGGAAVAAGVYLLIHGGDLRALPGYESYYGVTAQSIVSVATGIILAIGVALLVIGVVDIVLGVTVGRPSNVSRWFNIVVNTITGIIALFGLIGQLSNGRMAGVLFFAVWLGVNIVIFYALAINAQSRHAFG